MSSVRATVIVPTSIDRGPLLPYSVGSILNQTVCELEVFIIGDGVHEVTREAARALERQDARVRFFDHPKGPRRGEIYRHQALQEARGEIVCYLCDRDLYLPNHVEEMMRLLQSGDFAHSLIYQIRPNGQYTSPVLLDLAQSNDRRVVQKKATVPLSFMAHTLVAYHRLPIGWETTPDGNYTDAYQVQKFLTQSWCLACSGTVPTLLYFHREGHPGWSTEMRLREIRLWSNKIKDECDLQRIRGEVSTLNREPLSGRRLKLNEFIALHLLTRQHRPWAQWLRCVYRWAAGKQSLPLTSHSDASLTPAFSRSGKKETLLYEGRRKT